MIWLISYRIVVKMLLYSLPCGVSFGRSIFFASVLSNCLLYWLIVCHLVRLKLFLSFYPMGCLLPESFSVSWSSISAFKREYEDNSPGLAFIIEYSCANSCTSYIAATRLKHREERRRFVSLIFVSNIQTKMRSRIAYPNFRHTTKNLWHLPVRFNSWFLCTGKLIL